MYIFKVCYLFFYRLQVYKYFFNIEKDRKDFCCFKMLYC